MKLTIKLKFILFNLLITIASLSIFYAAIYHRYSQKLIFEIDRGLEQNSGILKRVLKFDVNNKLDLYSQRDDGLLSYNGAPLDYRIWSESGLPLRRSVGMMFVESTSPKQLNNPYTETFAGIPYRMLNVEHIKYFNNSNVRLVLQLIHPMRAYQQNMTDLNRTMLFLFPIPLLLVALGSYWISQNNLKGLYKLIKDINQTNAENLSQSLPVTKMDEVGELTQAYNKLLSRLTSAFEALKRFTSDASHELRTPLMAIKSQGEIVLAKERQKTEYVDAIGAMLEDTQRLENLCTSLLQLARGDAGLSNLNKKEENLSSVVNYWINQFLPWAEEKNIYVSYDIKANIFFPMDQALLERVFINLIENAINYSTSPGKIEIKFFQEKDNIIFQIDDTAPVIAKEHRERVFQRFVRLDNTRNTASGAGLGLSISQLAAKKHNGIISIEKNPWPGNRFKLILKRSSESLHHDQ